MFTAADVITTKIALATGRFREANPLMAPFVNNIIEVKLVGLVFIAVLIYLLERRRAGHGWVSAAGAACATFLAVLSNIIQIATA